MKRGDRSVEYCPKCGLQEVIQCKEIDEDNAGWQHYCTECDYGYMSYEDSYLDRAPDFENDRFPFQDPDYMEA